MGCGAYEWWGPGARGVFSAGVGVDIDVNELGVVCAADGDESVELDAGWAFKGGEHIVAVGVI